MTRFRLLLGALLAVSLGAHAEKTTLLNASYDISRELFAEYNALFAKHWQEKTGNPIDIKQSHAGSSKQANAILHGLKADVVTFNQVSDVQVLHDKGALIPADWAARLPNNSSPYYSTMAFLVREGNPKNIADWGDLQQEGVSIVFPNPKTSGNGRYTYLAALGYAQDTFGDEAARDAFMRDLLKRVAVSDTGGRGATTSFVERNIGDVLITFESEIHNIKKEYPDRRFTVVVPKTSILAEFPVARIDQNTDANGTTDAAQAYLEYLYSPEAQALLAAHHYRVHDADVKAAHAAQFPDIKLKTVEDIAGSFAQAMKTHFDSGAKLDQLQRAP